MPLCPKERLPLSNGEQNGEVEFNVFSNVKKSSNNVKRYNGEVCLCYFVLKKGYIIRWGANWINGVQCFQWCQDKF